ncbi:MAG: AmmeMemoRadiSam system protein B [Elusimicrobia bacterium]|nr:AmmeMemoRadiSam system protein B [Elusimicrobiota bacterium]
MNIRKPAVAGQFYPSNPDELSLTVDEFLGNVPNLSIKGTPVAFLVPHAGYIFSAQTAAYSYKLLSKTAAKNVILIGNCHNFPLYCGAIFPEGQFKTPLGNIETDEKIAKQIIKNSKLLALDAAPHISEHSLEVQLPFLQRVLKNFKIVPILLGNFSMQQCKEIGEAIAKAIIELKISESTVIIASSDMSHYPSESEAKETDKSALEALEKFDPELLKKTIDNLMSQGITELHCVFCGEESIYTTMFASKYLGAKEIKVLNYSNSAKTSGDKSRVVGYGAAVFLK